MRKLCCLILCLLVGCSGGKNQQWQQEDARIKVLSTIAMIDDLVKDIGGEYVDAVPLIRGELDPHSYELVKGDDERFLQADLIFYNGLGLEHTLSMRQNLEDNPKAVAVGDPILRDCPSLILQIDRQYDPHIWMDITLWMRTIETIVNELCKLDPEHATIYAERGQQLYTKMEEADRIVYQTMQAIPAEKRYLITSHDAFHYFTRRYLALPNEKRWRERCAAPEGLAPDAQLSTADIHKIMRHIERHHVSVIFPESNLSRDSLRKIVRASRARGCPVLIADEPLFGDSMGNADSYLGMVSHNVSVISRELMRQE